uniref:Acyl carrier protein n=1 Tax=Rhodococcus erythropolis TaxID=1833 RepID=Q2V0N9_RHOER|nr:probable acyl carrier protein [Rhodococcus erythropolis]
MAHTQEEIIAELGQIVEEVTGIEPSEVTVDKSFVDDLDIDSLSMVEIAVQTEDKYGVKVPDEDLAGLRTVGEIIAELGQIVEEVTGIEPSEVTVDKSFVDDLDIDSLSMVEIAVQTEDKYGVKVPDEDLAGLRTVGDIVAYIQKLEAEGAEAKNAE